MQTTIQRRQLLRLIGAGALLGSTVGTTSANESRFIVGTSTPAATRAARAEARSVHRVLDFGPIGQAVSGVFSEQALRGLSRRADVRYVEPDGRLYAIAIDAGDAEVPWGVDRVDAEKAQTAGETGAGAKVAVVDTGIDYDHPDLNVVDGVAFALRNPNRKQSTDPTDYDDGNGHGTHCAGTVGAIDDGAGVVGVAPGVDLYAVKVLNDNGSGSWSDVADGIRWTGDNGIHVASMSLGGGYSQTVEDACQYAYEQKGVLLVAAAGNDGPGTADDHYPAASVHVMSVGATDDTDAIASFSSTGSVLEISAPGVDIPSTWKDGGYNTISGTSMACPHVAGGGALLRANGVAAVDARTTLKSTADDLGPSGWDEAYGEGLVDAEEAATGTTDSDGGTGDTTAPTVSVQSPTDGAEVSGDVTVAVSASDDVDATGTLDVDVTIDTTTVDTTYDDTTGLYEYLWTTGDWTDGTYPVSATATDAAGNTASAGAISVTVANGMGSGDTTAPSGSVDGVTVLSPNNPHAEYAVDWTVADDVALADVTVELRRAGATVVDTVPTAVSGTGPVSGTTDVSEKFGSGNSYEVRVVVTDAAGNGFQSVWQAV